MVNHVYFRVYNIHVMVYIQWIYNFNTLGLLFPSVYNINPLGLLM